MNLHHYLALTGDPVETCVIGTGGFGRSFIVQGQRVPAMNVRIAVDLDTTAAAHAFEAGGIDAARIRLCHSPAEARQAWQTGHCVVADALETVIDLPIDVVVEATGHPEAGARHAALTIEAGYHLALVSKEVDSVIGPGLSHMARQKGRIVTPVDGDQPSLLIGLISWAQTLGMDIIAAGKSSEYDFVFDPASSRLTSNGRSIKADAFHALWSLSDGPAEALLSARAQAASALPQCAVPDLCELAVVANATGLLPDRPPLHCPIARLTEVADIFSLRTEGGLLDGTQRLDVFNCLRRRDEFSLAGGVFLTVRCHDRASWQLLADKGHLLSRDMRTATIPLPRHLLGLEAATSVLEAARGVSSGATIPRPRLDLVAIATAPLPAGSVLTAYGHHHTIDHVTAELWPAAPLGERTPLPFYLAANRRLTRRVAPGQPICLSDIEPDTASRLWQLRQQQDALFT